MFRDTFADPVSGQNHFGFGEPKNRKSVHRSSGPWEKPVVPLGVGCVLRGRPTRYGASRKMKYEKKPEARGIFGCLFCKTNLEENIYEHILHVGQAALVHYVINHDK